MSKYERDELQGSTSVEASSEPLSHTTREKYANLRAQGVRQISALKVCRISKSTAGRWEKDSAVQARIYFLVSQTTEGQCGENEAECRRITIDRNDIVMGLADIAQDKYAPASARVAAFSKLADIFMLVPKSVKDIKEFYGWTEEELIECRRTDGKFIPERFKPYIGNSADDEEQTDPGYV